MENRGGYEERSREGIMCLPWNHECVSPMIHKTKLVSEYRNSDTPREIVRKYRV